MKKIIYILALFIISNMAAFSMEIQGGVTFNVDSAREYVQQGETNYLQFSGHEYFNKYDKGIKKVIYSYSPMGDVIGITVTYKDSQNMAYIYSPNNNLRFVDKYDKDIDIYPHRGYRYRLDGQLDLMSLTVSKNEQFRFAPDGRLIAHAKNGVIYDENGNIIGRASR